MEFRQENLDLIAERLLGPKGYFNTQDLRDVVRDGKEKWTELENSIKQRLNNAIRGKRSVTKEALEEVRQKVRTKCDTNSLGYESLTE
jgi:polyhydroxyalkanoate synthesis regulator phasin